MNEHNLQNTTIAVRHPLSPHHWQRKDESRVRGWLRAVGAGHGVLPTDTIHLLSAKIGYGVQDLFKVPGMHICLTS